MHSFFYNRPINKGEIKKLVHWFLMTKGAPKTLQMIDRLKTLGFHSATQAGLSLGIEDLMIPPVKPYLLGNAQNEVYKNEERFSRGNITAVERSQKVIDIWNTTSELLKEEVVIHFRQTDLLNPVYMMAFSGARGNISQVRQLVGMRGLMSDPQGEIIDLPIKTNFREGLTVTEYIISCYGARKGLVDTALKTANSGYLTRRLVDVAQAVIIKEVDCHTNDGIFLSALTNQAKVLLSLEKRLVGRVLARDIKHNNNLIAKRNQDITYSLAKKIVQLNKTRIFIRSPLTCQTIRHTCRFCYGWNLANGQLVDLGEAVGIIAAQSIGEPGTQLTMRTFHTGGVFTSDVAERVYAPHSGIIDYDLGPETDKKITRTTYGQEAIYFTCEKEIYIRDPEIKDTKLVFPPYTLLFVPTGKQVYAKQIIAEFSNKEQICFGSVIEDGIETKKEVLADISGQVFVQDAAVYNQDRFVLRRSSTPVLNQRDDGLLFVLAGQIFSSAALNYGALKDDLIYDIQELNDLIDKKQIHKGKDFLLQKTKHSQHEYRVGNHMNETAKTFSGGVLYKKESPNLPKVKELFWVPFFTKDISQNFAAENCFEEQILDYSYYQSWVNPSKEHRDCRLYPVSQISTLPSSKIISNTRSLSFSGKAHSIAIRQRNREKFLEYCSEENHYFVPGSFSLEQTFPAWFYLPKRKPLKKTKKSLKKLFSNNFSVVEPYTKLVDSISFNEQVFIEWLAINPATQVCLFRKIVKFNIYPSSIFDSTKMDVIKLKYSTQVGGPILKKKQANIVAKQKETSGSQSELTKEKLDKPKNFGEVAFVTKQKQYFVKTDTDQIKLSIKNYEPLVYLREFLSKGDPIAERLVKNQSGALVKQIIRTTESGRVSKITKNFIVLHKSHPYRVSKSSPLSVWHNSLVYEGNTLFHLIYKKAKAEDIVQGLPKVEELLEARRTKDLKPIANNPHDRLKEQFEKYKETYNIEFAAKKSILETQQFLVNGVQGVYQSQGVDISDKHIEIIVKQMTSKVFIEDTGDSNLMYGDLIELYHVKEVIEENKRKGLKVPEYEPTILGITKASLKTESFISAASFQETTRVLTQAALEGKKDYFIGLKENVIIGRLIPAGTGFKENMTINNTKEPSLAHAKSNVIDQTSDTISLLDS